MPSTFFGLEIARRALAMSQLNLLVIGHNIANAGTPGYSRQRAELVPAPPLAYPCFTRPGFVQQIGSGVDVDAVRRIRDEFLDEIIRLQTGAQGRNTTVAAAFRQIELIFNEPGQTGLGTVLDNFFTAWQDLANYPELVSTRANLREQAISLVRTINDLDISLKRLAIEQVDQLRLRVDEVNLLARQMADLNIQIAQIKALGDNPNDLMDQRDLLLERLSELLAISTIEQANGTLSVLIGGLRIIEDDKVQELVVVSDPDDRSQYIVRFKNGLLPDLAGKGVLGGLLEARRVIIPFFQDRLNTFTTALTNRVNVQHRLGFGLDGAKGRPFFSDLRTAEMVATLTLPLGTDEDTPLDELGITAGDFTIQGKTITIFPADVAPGEAIKLGELLDRITNAQPFVRAVLDTNVLGVPFLRLDLYNPVEKDTTISVYSGTSNFLTVMGLEDATTAFLEANDIYGNSADMFAVSMIVLENLDVIAAAGDDGSGVFSGPGNNDNALAIASLQSSTDAVADTTFGDYYASTIAELGSQGQTATRLVANQGVLLSQLGVQRESTRGVNLDEEATKMITYQRIYEGAARVVQVVDSMLDTLINRMAA